MKRARRALGVVVRGAGVARCPAPCQGFEDERFPKAALTLTRHLQQSNRFTKPTPIQAQCWPAVMSGNDVICVAETGSGKTMGYVLPIAPHILAQRKVDMGPAGGPVALILVPTRELAQQVRSVCRSLRARTHSLNCVAIVGGVAKNEQLEALRARPIHILVATPGRLVDLLGEGKVQLRRTTYVVLDEAEALRARD
jgi:ATP-dependent RNA helicase DDX5/DBP2